MLGGNSQPSQEDIRIWPKVIAVIGHKRNNNNGRIETTIIALKHRDIADNSDKPAKNWKVQPPIIQPTRSLTQACSNQKSTHFGIAVIAPCRDFLWHRSYVRVGCELIVGLEQMSCLAWVWDRNEICLLCTFKPLDKFSREGVVKLPWPIYKSIACTNLVWKLGG